MNIEIAKAGWLFRQSTILKRWKKNWFVLYRDGSFKYYEDRQHNSAEDVIEMNVDCSDVFSEVLHVTPPHHLDASCLFSLKKVNGDVWLLCAENIDDKKAWEFVLNDARLLPPYIPPPPYNVAYPNNHYNVYDGVTYTSMPAYYQQHQIPYDHHYQNSIPTNTTTIIYANQPPYYYRRPVDGADVAMGVVAGAAGFESWDFGLPFDKEIILWLNLDSSFLITVKHYSELKLFV
ncbi:hypothetical protein HELRODRAFT_193605 [Helobdella robusta]|uniref:PH domain-containing protein n=1 Tax=Helobdella robusta TaxID=6412 RepID=T1FV62_HELRO|nr:hypothetical protein HELRODRAFT_193605 [Helobdella robusta]ESN95259.1 hypothetical protein HELRODRAFT_193605 [Helobdella robusta]